MAIKFTDHGNPIPNGNLLIVDGFNIIWRWIHAKKLDFQFDFIRTVESLAKSYDCGGIVVLGDGGSHYRKDIYPEYKANRTEKLADQTEAEKQEFQDILEEFDLSLKSFQERGIPTLRFGGVEADDIAAYIVQKKEDFNINEIWLISSDKDWDLLIQEGVSRFSTVTRKETTLLNWDEHYEVDPEMYLTYKCLTGDKGDNIPGIKGVGPKRATQLISQYGDIYDIYNSCPIDSRYKFIEELNNNKEQLLLNVELMDLVTYSETALGKHTKVVDDIVGNYI